MARRSIPGLRIQLTFISEGSPGWLGGKDGWEDDIGDIDSKIAASPVSGPRAERGRCAAGAPSAFIGSL
jgi:hypothetical protein